MSAQRKICFTLITALIIVLCNGQLTPMGRDECLTSPCDVNANCTVKDCECNTEFSGDGPTCADGDSECLRNPCSINTDCIEGSYDCQCKTGFSGDGFNCSNINECPSNPCDLNADCIDNEGSFNCECKLGYTGDGFSCTNVNECLLNPCDVNAECTDNEGSFDCQCKTGFSGDGLTCEKFNDILMDVQYNGFSGDTLEITCLVSGPSQPNFEWRNNSMILSLSTRVKIETNNKISKLFVRGTAKFDSGNYFCIASKGKATINSSVSVTVKVPPVVSVTPLSVSATEGDTITLTCEVTVGNENNIEIMWFSSKQAGIIGENRELDLSSDIKLPDNEQRFTAEYWCFAKNSDGTGRSQNVTVQIISTGFDEFCLKEEDSGNVWEKTPVSTLVIKSCPEGKTGDLSRFCNIAGGQPVWDDVNLFNCRSVAVINLLDQVDRLDEGFEAGNVGEIFALTEDITGNEELYEKDIEDIVNVLGKTQQKTKSQSDRQNFIVSVSNIIDNQHQNTWENIQDRNDLIKTLISATDQNARNFISQSEEIGKIISFNTTTIDVIGVQLMKTVEHQDFMLVYTSGEGVVIPGDITNNIQQATVVKYSSIKDILSEDKLRDSVDNTIKSSASLTIRSTVLSFTTEPQLNDSVPQPFKILLKNNQTDFENPRRTCAFIEPEKNGSKWSSQGCTLNKAESNEENVTCDCDHNTAFAIMMDVSEVPLTETERKTLELISTVGCSISLLGIALTFFIHVFVWKEVKSTRAKILLSLCIAIGFTDIFAILEGVARDNESFCKAVAALLHFFVLTTFGWMLCEGILLYILLIRIFQGVRGKHWKIFNFIGWGIPALIVIVSVGATQGDGYGTAFSCWLSVENKLIWAFVGPAFLVIVINTAMFIMVLRTLMSTKKLKQKDNLDKVKAGVKASAVIFPILGLTWVFGLMTFNRDTLYFRYIFAVLNSTQGMLIFLFHIVLNKQVREVVRKKTSKKSTSNISSNFSKPTSPHRQKGPIIPSRKSSLEKVSSLNQRMVETNATLQLENSGLLSESGRDTRNLSTGNEGAGRSSTTATVHRENNSMEQISSPAGRSSNKETHIGSV